MSLTKHEEPARTQFQLHPFTAGASTANLDVYGYLVRRSGAVQIDYMVKGALDRISWPRITQATERCHELWRQTCFELFLGIKDNAAYWEVNLSPSGLWNVYCFSDYRTGMREEKAIAQPVCHIATDGDLLSLNCTIDFNGLIDDCSDLEVGVSSVLQTIDGSNSYWAIDHYGRKPDFHNRSSFSVVLPGAEEFNNE
ncbi:MAG: DOMON-like domain-containing protein [Desulfobulbaceae bacterium]|nr:DOMON-like domain-containing protein [Desulfobulbaceae bacterium]